MNSCQLDKRPVGIAAAVTAVILIVACGGGQTTPSAAAQSGIPAHVTTYQFFGVNGIPKGYPHVSPQEAAKWVTWAMTSPQLSASLSAAGMKTVLYTDPNRVAPNDKEYSSDETEFTHDCSGKRVAVTKGGERYLTDPSSQALRERWKAEIAQAIHEGKFEAFFDDTAGSTQALSGLPCNFDENRWIDAHVDFVKSAGVPIIVNGLGDGDLPHQGRGPNAQYQMSPVSKVLQQASNAIGGSFEDCYASPNHPSNKGGNTTAGSYWQQTENTELAVARLNKIFVCNERAKHLSMDSAIDARYYTEASFLLTYDIHFTMVRQQFVTPSQFNLGPEVELVALEPVVPTPQTIDGLKQSSGAYGREYRTCYIAGSPVGPCAAAANSDLGETHNFPFSGYSHTLVIRGSGIMDGGTIATNGPAPGALGSLQGVVAFK